MRRTKKDRRRYAAGEKGRNRVWAFPDHKTGMMQLEWRECGRRRQRSLKHRDWDLAKTQADEFAASYVQPKPEESEPPPTLGKLFDIYLKEVTPEKGDRSRKHDRTAIAMFRDFLGEPREPESISQRDWDRFIKLRGNGTVGPSGRSVGPRTIERDLRLLKAVFNWAERSKTDDGRPMLGRNPLTGMKTPREKNPRRLTLSSPEYEALRRVAAKVDWRFRVALMVAHGTGHRIGAIRQLQWSDIDLKHMTILWRAENEKTGFEHVTPMTKEVEDALLSAKRRRAGVGATPVFPAPRDPSKPASRYLFRSWWKRAEKLAGLEGQKGRGWHSLRRKFASEMMHMPLKVLCDLGGWKNHRTVIECYQQTDPETLRKALENRKTA